MLSANSGRPVSKKVVVGESVVVTMGPQHDEKRHEPVYPVLRVEYRLTVGVPVKQVKKAGLCGGKQSLNSE